MPTSGDINGIAMADIADINGVDVPSGGGGTVSTTPTANLSFAFGAATLTITNHNSSYTNPNYQVSVSVDGSEIISDADVDHTLESDGDTLSATMTWTDNNSSTNQRTVTVRAQEFGDNVQSAALTLNYTPSYTAYRYIRVTNANANKETGAGKVSWLAINEWTLYDDVGQSGEDYPTTNLTSDTSETGIALTSNNVYSIYSKWKAFDGATNTRFWTVYPSGGSEYLQIEFEPATYSTPPTIKSMNLNVQYAFHLLFEGSNDGTNYTEIAFVGPMSSSSNNAGNSNLNIG